MANIDKFIRYAKIDTQASGTSGTTPSTEKQKNLSRLLVEELKQLGLEDAHMDEFGIVYGHLKGDDELSIGLNAHVDTALEVTDTDVKPRIVQNYQGEDIILNEQYKLSIKDFPHLKNHIGHDLVVTDGNTLLGADDKAGIAIIMSALEFLHNHPEVKHHNISVAFTVDEEIGEGPDHFSVEKMDADFGYTLDGASPSNIDFENFNAQGVKLEIEGVSVHPGEGKNALINAALILNDFINEMPKGDTPFEAGYDDGYWHINDINGSSDYIEMTMILRDFDRAKLEARDKIVLGAVEKLKQKYPKAKINVSIREQYENMKPYVLQKPEVIKFAEKALIKNGLMPVNSKIRGGTDGATFSKMGFVCPNLGTGSYNHHGRYEFLDIQEYELMIKIVLDILKL